MNLLLLLFIEITCKIKNKWTKMAQIFGKEFCGLSHAFWDFEPLYLGEYLLFSLNLNRVWKRKCQMLWFEYMKLLNKVKRSKVFLKKLPKIVRSHPKLQNKKFEFLFQSYHQWQLNLCIVWTKNVRYFKCSNKTAVFDLFLYYYDIYFYM